MRDIMSKTDNKLLNDNPYRDKFLYVCRQLSEEHKYILRLETIIGNQRKELKRLNDSDSKQAIIDELMLEYCPDEMTKEQIENWEKYQRGQI